LIEHENAWLHANRRHDRRNDRVSVIIDALLTAVCLFFINHRLVGNTTAAESISAARRGGVSLCVAARNRNVADAQSRALFDAQSVRTSVTTNAR
jgi:hypothetical protein